MALRVEARTAAGDLHSGSFGGSVANAAHALAGVLAALHAPDGAVAAPAFYADVAPLTAAQRDAFRALPRDDAADKASAGAALPHSAPPHARAPLSVPIRTRAGVEQYFGETGFSTLERRWRVLFGQGACALHSPLLTWRARAGRGRRRR